MENVSSMKLVPAAKQVGNCHLILHISMTCCQKWKFQAHYKQTVPAPQTPYLQSEVSHALESEVLETSMELGTAKTQVNPPCSSLGSVSCPGPFQNEGDQRSPPI